MRLRVGALSPVAAVALPRSEEKDDADWERVRRWRKAHGMPDLDPVGDLQRAIAAIELIEARFLSRFASAVEAPRGIEGVMTKGLDELAEDMEREDRELRRKLEASRVEYERVVEENRVLRQQLRVVQASAEDVWFWQGDEYDHPESLACPVVMEAATLCGILRRRPAYDVEALFAGVAA